MYVYHDDDDTKKAAEKNTIDPNTRGEILFGL